MSQDVPVKLEDVSLELKLARVLLAGSHDDGGSAVSGHVSRNVTRVTVAVMRRLRLL